MRAGTIRVQAADPDPWYALTSDGGQIWQAERAPDWSLYCVAAEGESDEGVMPVELTAFSRDVGVAYLTLAKSCGVYPDCDLSRVAWTRPEASPIYWMGDPQPWSTTLLLREGAPEAIDRERFRRELLSWSSLQGLRLGPGSKG